MANKTVLKWNHALWFVFSIQASVYATTAEAYSLESVYCKFFLYVSVEIDPYNTIYMEQT